MVTYPTVATILPDSETTSDEMKPAAEDTSVELDMWIEELAQRKERSPGQIDQLLQDLGPIPSWEEPS